MQTNRSGCRKTTDARATRGFDRSIAARLCSFVYALSPRNLWQKRDCSQFTPVGKELAGEQNNNIQSNHNESDVKCFYKTLYFILTYLKWFAMVITPTLLSQWREHSIVHYLQPGKYEPRYHISKLDTVYIQRIYVMQYTIMKDISTKTLGIDKELTTAVSEI